MFQIICPSCSNKNQFDTVDKKPVECSFCFSTFNDTIKAEEIADEKKLIGLRLVYQQTSDSIAISGTNCILGRENFGSLLFSGIRINGCQVISRKHCSINLIDGKYYLKDEGSLNGTYYGVSKIDCSKEPQVIENNSMVFLGKEAFLVQFQYEELKVPDPLQTEKKAEVKAVPIKYQCNQGCGFESDIYIDMCPRCMTSDSMVGIYE
jgi:hypothetical protein